MLAALLTSAALASAPPPPVVGGRTTRDHDAVGAFVASNGELWGAFCSGTLIGESDVLTAAHCVDAMIEYNRSGFDISFATGTDLNSESGVDTNTLVSSALPHPSYADTPVLTADIAIARLAAAPDGIDPIPLNDAAPMRTDWGFSTLTHVGWGADDDDGTGGGVKREVELQFADFDNDFLYTLSSDGSNVCVGDSGGAALGRTSSGDWVVAGVNAFVFDPEGGVPRCEGGASGSTRVDAHLDFIEDAVDLAEPDEGVGWSSFELDGGAGNGTIQDSSKAGCSAVGGGASLVLAGLGLLAVGRRRS